jgi:hypothetical protein
VSKRLNPHGAMQPNSLMLYQKPQKYSRGGHPDPSLLSDRWTCSPSGAASLLRGLGRVPVAPAQQGQSAGYVRDPADAHRPSCAVPTNMFNAQARPADPRPAV